jgi:hypothetical protein
MKPTSAPCTTKTAMIDSGRAPRVRRMAMSACLSVTAMTSVDTRLKAATATISERMMNIIVLLDLHRAEEIGVAAGPVADEGVGVDGAASSRADPRRHEQVVDLEPHAADPVVHLVELLRVAHVDQREAAVVLVHADLEDADHLEGFQPRHDPGRRHRALRRDQRHLVAGEHAQRARQVGAEHDAELAGRRSSRLPLLIVLRKSATRSSCIGQDAAHQGPLDAAIDGEHRLRLDEGRRRADLRVLRRLRGRRSLASRSVRR